MASARQRVREVQSMLMSAHHWRARLVLWTAAAAVAGAAVAFAWLADTAQAVLEGLLAHSHDWPWLLAPAGFGLIAWLTRRFFPGAEGSGIAQTIRSGQLQQGGAVPPWLRPRAAVGRVLLGVAGLLCGGSIGREGATVHVGAVIAHAFGRLMPHGIASAQQRVLILTGGAAGIAAAFNMPLAGIVFAVEELARTFEERASGTAVLAVVLAGLISIALVGDYAYFGHPLVRQVPRTLSVAVLGLAVCSGLAGGLFSRLTLAGVPALAGSLGRVRARRPVFFAALCGLLLAAIGSCCGALTYGTGYVEARAILAGSVHLPWYYAPARALATLVTLLAGVPAGLLTPSLSAGAGLGQLAAGLGGGMNPVTAALLGMCGYLAAVTQAPLTCLVIVMGMTAQRAMLLPLMVTAALAAAVSRLVSPPLYQTLAQRCGPLPRPAELGQHASGR